MSRRVPDDLMLQIAPVCRSERPQLALVIERSSMRGSNHVMDNFCHFIC